MVSKKNINEIIGAHNRRAGLLVDDITKLQVDLPKMLQACLKPIVNARSLEEMNKTASSLGSCFFDIKQDVDTRLNSFVDEAIKLRLDASALLHEKQMPYETRVKQRETRLKNIYGV